MSQPPPGRRCWAPPGICLPHSCLQHDLFTVGALRSLISVEIVLRNRFRSARHPYLRIAMRRCSRMRLTADSATDWGPHARSSWRGDLYPPHETALTTLSRTTRAGERVHHLGAATALQRRAFGADRRRAGHAAVGDLHAHYRPSVTGKHLSGDTEVG